MASFAINRANSHVIGLAFSVNISCICCIKSENKILTTKQCHQEGWDPVRVVAGRDVPFFASDAL